MKRLEAQIIPSDMNQNEDTVSDVENTELAKLKEELAHVRQQNNANTLALVEAEERLEEVNKKRVVDIKNALADLSKQHKEKMSALVEAQNREKGIWLNQKKSLTSERDGLALMLDSVKQDTQSYRMDKNSAKEEREALEERISVLEAKLEANREDMEEFQALKRTSADDRSLLRSYESQMDAMRKEIRTFKGKLKEKTLTVNVSQLLKEKQSAQEECEMLKSELNKVELSLRQAQSDLSQEKSQLGDLKKGAQGVETVIDNLRAENESLRHEVDRCLDKLRTAKTEYLTAKDEIQRLEMEVQRLRNASGSFADFAALKRDIRDLREERDNLALQLRDALQNNSHSNNNHGLNGHYDSEMPRSNGMLAPSPSFAMSNTGIASHGRSHRSSNNGIEAGGRKQYYAERQAERERERGDPSRFPAIGGGNGALFSVSERVPGRTAKVTL